jgi:hypothetical protein
MIDKRRKANDINNKRGPIGFGRMDITSISCARVSLTTTRGNGLAYLPMNTSIVTLCT